MKATFEAEDAVIGIICGLLLIGYTGHFFSLKLNNYVYVGAFAVFIIFILIDLAWEFHDLTTHFGLIVFSIVHNLIDLVLSLGFISHFSGWNIPYITAYIVPYLQEPVFMYWAGLFLVIGNAIWLFIFPFAS